jgi:hypothetical protein
MQMLPPGDQDGGLLRDTGSGPIGLGMGRNQWVVVFLWTKELVALAAKWFFRENAVFHPAT